MVVAKFLLGIGASGVGSDLTITGAARVRIAIAWANSLIILLAGLITTEKCSELKMRYTNLRDWIKFTTILWRKTLRKH